MLQKEQTAVYMMWAALLVHKYPLELAYKYVWEETVVNRFVWGKVPVHNFHGVLYGGVKPFLFS